MTQPDLPPKLIVEQEGIRVVHYYRSGDHAPPHVHVFENDLHETRIGQNGIPLAGDAPLTASQAAVVRANRAVIRRAVRKIGRWHWFIQQ
jgi:hypothetical protein